MLKHAFQVSPVSVRHRMHVQLHASNVRACNRVSVHDTNIRFSHDEEYIQNAAMAMLRPLK